MRNHLLTFIAAVLVTLLLVRVTHFDANAGHKETAYERVIRTGVLRCAYGLWDPAVIRDPNTGQMSGLVYDIMQEVGKSLNLKVEYQLEVSWDAIASALATGKADAHCAGVVATPARGRAMAFSNPMFFSPMVAFARIDDDRFDFKPERINQPDVIAVVSDDDITTEIYEHDFSKAKRLDLPQMSSADELFMAIATKKADVTFISPARLYTYEKNNPGKVKAVPMAAPLRILPHTISVDIDESELLNMLNTAVNQVVYSGMVNQLLDKYRAKYDVDFIVRVNLPYTWKN